jgi:hypothetical protein
MEESKEGFKSVQDLKQQLGENTKREKRNEGEKEVVLTLIKRGLEKENRIS